MNAPFNIKEKVTIITGVVGFAANITGVILPVDGGFNSFSGV
jgi:hypothetical protein